MAVNSIDICIDSAHNLSIIMNSKTGGYHQKLDIYIVYDLILVHAAFSMHFPYIYALSQYFRAQIIWQLLKYQYPIEASSLRSNAEIREA